MGCVLAASNICGSRHIAGLYWQLPVSAEAGMPQNLLWSRVVRRSANGAFYVAVICIAAKATSQQSRGAAYQSTPSSCHQRITASDLQVGKMYAGSEAFLVRFPCPHPFPGQLTSFDLRTDDRNHSLVPGMGQVSPPEVD